MGASAGVFYFEGDIMEEPWHQKTQHSEQDIAYLIIALRMVTEMGISKNRGFGRCRFHIMQPENWKELVEKYV